MQGLLVNVQARCGFSMLQAGLNPQESSEWAIHSHTHNLYRFVRWSRRYSESRFWSYRREEKQLQPRRVSRFNCRSAGAEHSHNHKILKPRGMIRNGKEPSCDMTCNAGSLNMLGKNTGRRQASMVPNNWKLLLPNRICGPLTIILLI